jgi:uncharacterized ion transporter superfamily protein YfcC
MKKILNLKTFLILFFIIIALILTYFCLNYLKIQEENKKINIIEQEIRLKKQIEEKKLLKKQEKIRNFLNSFDFKKDDSLTKFVSAKIPFTNKNYIPNNLVYLN